MRYYSIIIPIYNRPTELDELLESLTHQTYKNFEVVVIEDGSTERCEHICQKYQSELSIQYIYKENSGQGFSRNVGFEHAKGDYFVQFDSDAIIPPQYFESVEKALAAKQWDAYGGPDAAAESFTPVQKAINYAMTSVFTTGGIRGKAANMGGKFHPRSFNFGLSRHVYESVGGYTLTRMGEDILYSIRIIQRGFSVGLIPEAYIYHKRRTNFTQFFKQLHFFGRARINIARFHPTELKFVHAFPAAFTLFLVATLLLLILFPLLGSIALLVLGCYLGLVFFDSWIQNRSLKVAILSVFACLIQLSAYGIGFITEAIKGKKPLK